MGGLLPRAMWNPTGHNTQKQAALGKVTHYYPLLHIDVNIKRWAIWAQSEILRFMKIFKDNQSILREESWKALKLFQEP